MPNRLDSLEIRECSLVDRPANASIDPKTGRRVPRAVVAIWKRDGDEADIDKANVFHGGGGKFTDGGGASLNAHNASETAQLTDSPDDHRKASTAHAQAAEGHYKAAEKARLAGKKDEASAHRDIGDRHDLTAAFHSSRAVAVEKAGTEIMADDAWSDEDPLCCAVDGISKAEDGKTQDGQTFPRGDFAYTPDDVPSHWKLRLTSTPGGKTDAHIVGAAVAALGKGFRGQKVQIPSDALAGVKAKVRAAWRSANPDKGDDELPEVLKKGEVMNLEQIEKRLTDQDAVIAVIKGENEALRSENSAVLKMSKKDRKSYASMSEEARKEYMAGSEEKRAAMMTKAGDEECQKSLVNTMDDATKAKFAKAGPSERLELLATAEKAAKKKSGDSEATDGEPEPDADDIEAKKGREELALKMAASEDRVAKAEAELIAIRKRERLVQFAKRAENELPHTAGTPDEKGARLMKMADAFGGEESADFKASFEMLKAADAALAANFSEIGKVGGGSVPAEKALEAKAQEISKRDKVSMGEAMAKAMDEAPELYAEYEVQHHRAYPSR